MQQSFFESCGGAGNWPCHADRIELRGNFMTASWDDWITAPLSITPSALCAVSSLFSRSLSHPSAMTSLSFLASSPLLARGSFINVTSLYRRVHRIQLSGWILFFLLLLLLLLLNRGSFSGGGVAEMIARVTGRDTVIEFNPFVWYRIIINKMETRGILNGNLIGWRNLNVDYYTRTKKMIKYIIWYLGLKISFLLEAPSPRWNSSLVENISTI